MDFVKNEAQSEKKKMKALGFFTYGAAIMLLLFLLVLHVFNLYPIKTDKFSFFIISLAAAMLILPLVTYVKFFNIVELRKDTRIMKVQGRK